jgi:hypothetical protein
MSMHSHSLVVARAGTAACVLLTASLCSADRSILGRAAEAPRIVVLNDNGSWSWFEDERAVIDERAGTLVVSSVADASGTGGAARDGNVEVVTLDLETGATDLAVVHPHLGGDDHNSAALHVRRDGGVVAMYSAHATDTLTRWRTSGGNRGWAPELTIDHGVPVSYSNICAGGPDGRLYAFVRSVGRDPHVLVSDDDGATWRAGGRLLDGPGRPYVRYATDRAGRIHVITTDQHPRDVPTSVYHGIVDAGRLLRSDGTVVDPDLSDADAVGPERLTPVFTTDGSARAWTVDLQVDRRGHPRAVLSVHRGTTNEYWFAWFDGSAWQTMFLAHAGSALSLAEPFYTGLAAIDPADPRRVVVSTDVHPGSGVPLVSAADGRQHHELFDGITTDGGFTWQWVAMTADSETDNLRPIIPVGDRHRAVLWLRGRYTAYDDYDLDVVAVITDRPTRTPDGVEATIVAGRGAP